MPHQNTGSSTGDRTGSRNSRSAGNTFQAQSQTSSAGGMVGNQGQTAMERWLDECAWEEYWLGQSRSSGYIRQNSNDYRDSPSRRASISYTSSQVHSARSPIQSIPDSDTCLKPRSPLIHVDSLPAPSVVDATSTNSTITPPLSARFPPSSSSILTNQYVQVDKVEHLLDKLDPMINTGLVNEFFNNWEYSLESLNVTWPNEQITISTLRVLQHLHDLTQHRLFQRLQETEYTGNQSVSSIHGDAPVPSTYQFSNSNYETPISSQSRGSFHQANSSRDKDQKSLCTSTTRKRHVNKYTYACPVQKYRLIEDASSRCEGVNAKYMAEVRQHLHRKHQGEIPFLRLCRKCNEHVLDANEYQRHHNAGLCNTRPQSRMDPEQWKILYCKIFPGASRIPSPYNEVPSENHNERPSATQRYAMERLLEIRESTGALEVEATLNESVPLGEEGINQRSFPTIPEGTHNHQLDAAAFEMFFESLTHEYLNNIFTEGRRRGLRADVAHLRELFNRHLERISSHEPNPTLSSSPTLSPFDPSTNMLQRHSPNFPSVYPTSTLEPSEVLAPPIINNTPELGASQTTSLAPCYIPGPNDSGYGTSSSSSSYTVHFTSPETTGSFTSPMPLPYNTVPSINNGPIFPSTSSNDPGNIYSRIFLPVEQPALALPQIDFPNWQQWMMQHDAARVLNPSVSQTEPSYGEN